MRRRSFLLAVLYLLSFLLPLSRGLTDENICSTPCDFCCREKECRDKETCEGNYKPFVIAGSVIGSVLFLCVIRYSYKKFKLRKAKRADDKKPSISKDVKPKKSPSEGEIVKSVREQLPPVNNVESKDVFGIDDESNPKKKKGSSSDRSKNKKKKAPPSKVKAPEENLKERLNKNTENSSSNITAIKSDKNNNSDSVPVAVEKSTKPRDIKKETSSKGTSKVVDKKSSKLPDKKSSKTAVPQSKEYSSLDSQKEAGPEELNSKVSVSNREGTQEHEISIKINDEI